MYLLKILIFSAFCLEYKKLFTIAKLIKISSSFMRILRSSDLFVCIHFSSAYRVELAYVPSSSYWASLRWTIDDFGQQIIKLEPYESIESEPVALRTHDTDDEDDDDNDDDDKNRTCGWFVASLTKRSRRPLELTLRPLDADYNNAEEQNFQVVRAVLWFENTRGDFLYQPNCKYFFMRVQ